VTKHLRKKPSRNLLGKTVTSNHKIKQQKLESQNTTILYYIYRVSQEECAKLRESVSYVKVYRYNPKHLYPKLNGYGDNGQRKVRASCGSKYCNLHS
jgi:hypothetical protein